MASVAQASFHVQLWWESTCKLVSFARMLLGLIIKSAYAALMLFLKPVDDRCVLSDHLRVFHMDKLGRRILWIMRRGFDCLGHF
jgi:hypothetical protein